MSYPMNIIPHLVTPQKPTQAKMSDRTGEIRHISFGVNVSFRTENRQIFNCCSPIQVFGLLVVAVDGGGGGGGVHFL